MKFHFNERQRFSLRKYSFGLASVFLGTAFFLSGQVASADEPAVSETVTVAETSIQEKTESEQSATTTVETSLEASKDQASSEEKIENHEEKQDNNNSAQASDSNGQDLKNNEELARDEVSRQKSEITQSDTHEAKDVEKTIVKTSNQKETNADKETTDSPQNRSRREAPASGWDSSEVDGDNLSFKSVNIPVLPGQYVTRRDINSLKIENDMFDIPWTYNYVIVSKSRYGVDSRHRILNI